MQDNMGVTDADKKWPSINCPSCKGSNVQLKEIRANNGIFGPGYASWVTDSYFSCKDCGTRFDNAIQKKDV